MERPKIDPKAYFQILPEQFKQYMVSTILDRLPPEAKYDARQMVERLWKGYRGRDRDVLDVLGLAARKGVMAFNAYAKRFDDFWQAFAEVAWADREPSSKEYRVRELESIIENCRIQLGEKRPGGSTIVMQSPYQQKPQSNTLPKPGGQTKGT